MIQDEVDNKLQSEEDECMVQTLSFLAKKEDMLEEKVLLKRGDVKKIQPSIKESLTSSQILPKKGISTKKDAIKKGKSSKKAKNPKEKTSEKDGNPKVNEVKNKEHDEDSSILCQGKDEPAPFLLLV